MKKAPDLLPVKVSDVRARGLELREQLLIVADLLNDQTVSVDEIQEQMRAAAHRYQFYETAVDAMKKEHVRQVREAEARQEQRNRQRRLNRAQKRWFKVGDPVRIGIEGTRREEWKTGRVHSAGYSESAGGDFTVSYTVEVDPLPGEDPAPRFAQITGRWRIESNLAIAGPEWGKKFEGLANQ